MFCHFEGYNCPEISKHRKRTKDNLKGEELCSYSLFLQEAIHASWMQKESFKEFRSSIESLRNSLCGYSSYLLSKSKYQRLHNLLKEPAANPTDDSVTRFINRIFHTSDILQSLNQAICSISTYKPISLCDFAPADRRKRYSYIREVENGLLNCFNCFIYLHSRG